MNSNCKCLVNFYAKSFILNRRVRYFQTSIRNANISDIESIENCNIMSLPEHYDRSYYADCISNWPGLTFVAEDANKQVIAYALACIQEDNFHRNGFLTSIAVQPSSRGRGIGLSLMNAVHIEVSKKYLAESIYLHVRPSNFRALKFYRSLGYTENTFIQMYYGDGEAAWLLKKIFSN
jgi:ribosomal protein S18 acetylase RimI-like enzyme